MIGSKNSFAQAKAQSITTRYANSTNLTNSTGFLDSESIGIELWFGI